MEYVREEFRQTQHSSATSVNEIEPKTWSNSATTLTNETNKFEHRFGKIRDGGHMPAVNKVMLEGWVNFRFRETALNCGELLIALENIIIDMLSTAKMCVADATNNRY